MYGLTPQETAILKSLRRPEQIQRYLDEEIAYNKEKDRESCRSARMVIRDRLAHCLEGAFFAAAAIRLQGYPPLIVDLEAVRDDDHILAVFQHKMHWGAIAKSNYAGLRYREPVYRTLRELAMSYFEHYYNLQGEKTLRRYSQPIHLGRFDQLGWITAEEDVWTIPHLIARTRHFPLLTRSQIRGLSRIDKRLFVAGMVGAAH